MSNNTQPIARDTRVRTHITSSELADALLALVVGPCKHTRHGVHCNKKCVNA